MAVIAEVLRSLASTSTGIFSRGLNLLFQQAPVHDTQSIILGEESTVILGAGVIGLSTAYYLALSLKDYGAASSSLPPQIFVTEPSHDICPGASSGATGGVGDFGFSDIVLPLGSLSYELHKNIASAYGGEHNWGFRDQTIYRVTPKNFTGHPSPPDSWGPAPPVEPGFLVYPAGSSRLRNGLFSC